MTTIPSNQSTAATFTLATLQAVVESAKQRCPDLASRIDRAAGILATGRIEAGLTPRVWWVHSATNEDTEYMVTELTGRPWYCTCPDAKRRQTWCKHSIAVALLRRCQEREATPPEPPPPAAALALPRAFVDASWGVSMCGDCEETVRVSPCACTTVELAGVA